LIQHPQCVDNSNTMPTSPFFKNSLSEAFGTMTASECE
jgi:hypothetical protein